MNFSSKFVDAPQAKSVGAATPTLNRSLLLIFTYSSLKTPQIKLTKQGPALATKFQVSNFSGHCRHFGGLACGHWPKSQSKNAHLFSAIILAFLFY